MYRLRYFSKLSIAFIKRFKLVLIAGIGIGIVTFLVLKISLTSAIDSSIRTIGVSGRFGPENMPVEILTQISSGLTDFNAEGVVIPGLAEKWETPDGGKTWIFTLKNDLKWQDGSKIVADNIKYSFEDATTKALDADTLEFKLKSVFASFPAVVTKPVFKKGLLGAGEWQVQDLSVTSNFVQSLTLVSKSQKKTKIYKFYPSEEQLKLAYQLGEVREIADLSTMEPFDKWGNTTKITNTVNNSRFVAIFFNTGDAVLSEKKLRQALYYAINKDAFNTKGERAYGPLNPMLWSYNPQVKPYDFDPEHAKSLIKDLKNLTITLTTVPSLIDVAEKIAKDWDAIGVKTTVSSLSSTPGEYQAFLAIYDVPTDPDQYSLWHSTQTETNITKYKNPRIDKLLEEGRMELDQEKRKAIYFDFQRFLLEDVPAAFLYHPYSYTVSRK